MPQNDAMGAADLIRNARVRAGLTQRELAERCGTAQPVISTYEHGRRDPSLSTLRRIIAAADARLHITVDRLRDTDSSYARSAALLTPEQHAQALVDVLLLADAIPRREPPERRLEFPKIDSRAPRSSTVLS